MHKGANVFLRAPREAEGLPMRNVLLFTAALALAGCQARQGGAQADSGGASASAGTASLPTAKEKPYDGIAAGETVHFTGTEPFWGGEVTGNTLTYSTPENQAGVAIPVSRFAGHGGISWTGEYEGARFALAVTPGKCSDGMSDRTYPFVVTLAVSGEQRSGCAWTAGQPFSGPPHP